MDRTRFLSLLLICAVTAGTSSACSDGPLETEITPENTPPSQVRVGPPGSTPPVIVLEKNALSFSAGLGGPAPSTQTVGVTNGGGSTLKNLSVGKIVYGPGATRWLTASLSSKVAPATLNISVASTNLAEGTYTATVPVAAPWATNNPQSVTVTLAVLQTPVISLASGTVTFAATEGGIDPAAKTVAVTNGGGGTLTGLEVGAITYGQGATGWLTTAALNTTTGPATLTLQPTVGTLAAGTYTANVPIQSAVASNSPQTIGVTLTVGLPTGDPFTGTWSGVYDYGSMSAVLRQSGDAVTGWITDALGCVWSVSGTTSGSDITLPTWTLPVPAAANCPTDVVGVTLEGTLDSTGANISGNGTTTYPGPAPIPWAFSLNRQ